jgi:hypothetical protein
MKAVLALLTFAEVLLRAAETGDPSIHKEFSGPQTLPEPELIGSVKRAVRDGAEQTVFLDRKNRSTHRLRQHAGTRPTYGQESSVSGVRLELSETCGAWADPDFSGAGRDPWALGFTAEARRRGMQDLNQASALQASQTASRQETRKWATC